MDMKKQEANQLEFSYRRVRRPILNLHGSIMGTSNQSTADVVIPSTFRCTTCSMG